MSPKVSALLWLLSVLPIPSLGVVLAMMVWPDTTLGTSVFMALKVWILVVPTLYFFRHSKLSLNLVRPKKEGLLFGAIVGVVISLLIVLAYVLLGGLLIDVSVFRQKMVEVGLADPRAYIVAALYWITVNSFLEEYVWRWFVVRQAETLVGTLGAIIVSGLGFTLHHSVAMSLYFNTLTVFLCSVGVFIGGAVWSWLYIRYRNLWPAYVSHAIVDIAVFGIGWVLLF